MHRPRPDGSDLSVGQMSRSTSVSSDRPSLSGFSSLASPPSFVSPDAKYIASASAAAIISGIEERSVTGWAIDTMEGQDPAENIEVTQPCLALINAFLDQLLYKFLATARSSSLACIRGAVSDVLKPRVAREAIASADEELKQYLGGEVDDVSESQSGQDQKAEWDLDAIWKRTRLRCMVYTRHGDLEEDDEDMYLGNEDCDSQLSDSRSCPAQKSVSPTVAIFLTSILEFIGENCLMIAGDAARARAKLTKRKELDSQGVEVVIEDETELLVVQDCDMEKVAFDTALGRLWRSWRKRMRSPSHSSHSLHRPRTSDSYRRKTRPGHGHSVSQKSSLSNIDDVCSASGFQRKHSFAGSWQFEDPATIPLPISEDDVEEIEGCRLQTKRIQAFLDDLNRPLTILQKKRPSSVVLVSSPQNLSLSPADASPVADSITSPKLQLQRVRSNSMPVSPKPDLGAGAADNGQRDIFKTPLASPLGLTDEVTPKPSSFEAENDRSLEQNVNSESSSQVDVPESEIGVALSTPSEIVGTVPVPTDSYQRNRVNDEETAVMPPPPIPIARKSVDTASTPLEQVSTGVASQRSTPNSRHAVATTSKSIALSHSLDRASDMNGKIDHAQKTKIQEQILRASALTPSSPSEEYSPRTDSLRTTARRGTYPRPAGIVMDHNAPPLTPLREMTEASDGVSERQSHVSDEPGTSTERMLSEHLSRSNTSSTTRSHRQHSSASSGPKSRYQVQVATGAASDKTSNSDKSIPSHDPKQSKSIATENLKDVVNSVHAASDTNSLSSQRGRPSMSSQIRRPLASRTSSDGSVRSGRKGSIATTADEKKQSFEQLINSNETIRYDLTSQRLKDMEGTTPQPQEQPRPPTHKSFASSIKGFRSRSTEQPIPLLPLSATSSTASSIGVPIPTPSKSTFNSRAKVRARDARLDEDSLQSTRDLADFMRSTGPDNPIIRNRPPGMSQKSNMAAKPIAVINSDVPRTFTSPTTSGSSKPKHVPIHTRSMTTPTRRLQAREAIVPRTDESSELIDFIRQGPPNLPNGSHRIPRTVAPFRNTMDSDELEAMTPEKPKDEPPRSSVTSRSSNPTVPSSSNSRTALLDSTKRSNIPALDPIPSADEPSQPVRKQRRVRDPYEIPGSDDEDDDEDYELLYGRKKPQIKEESLMDFLNSVPPPPEPEPTPFALNRKDEKENGKRHKISHKKSSTSSFMAKFSRGGGGSSSPSRVKVQSISSPIAASRLSKKDDIRSIQRSATGAPQLSMPRMTSPLPQLGGYASPLERKTGGQAFQDMPQTKSNERRFPVQQPRSAQAVNGRSTEMADYLRNTMPPAMTAENHASFPAPKDENGFKKMFARRK